MVIAALYARVSSKAQENTLASQIAALENRILIDGHKLVDAFKFVDKGYSGSSLARPALERLRDQIDFGIINKVYIHSPDRLSRKYAYQMILIEEFERAGVEVIFLNFQRSASPESQLLVQGMISESGRSRIMEKQRRGRIPAAKQGSINALSYAPYGYQHSNKQTDNVQTSFETVEEEAEIVREIFN